MQHASVGHMCPEAQHEASDYLVWVRGVMCTTAGILYGTTVNQVDVAEFLRLTLAHNGTRHG